MNQDALKSLTLANSYIDDVQGKINDGLDSLNAEIAPSLLKTLELAEKQLEKAEKLDPTATLGENGNLATLKAQVFLDRGLVESYGLGKDSSAIKNIEKSISLLENFPNSHYVLGLLYADAGRKADALTQLRLAAEFSPDNIEYQKAIDRLENTSGASLKTSVVARQALTFRGSWKVLAVPAVIAFIGIILLLQGQIAAGILNILFWGGLAFGYWKWKTS
jgi:tetratricopeptide (TPR) repeat protein